MSSEMFSLAAKAMKSFGKIGKSSALVVGQALGVVGTEVIPVKPWSIFGLNNSPAFRAKCQQMNGTCWSFAGINAVSMCACFHKVCDDSLSEKHLLNWTNRREGESGFHVLLGDGGNADYISGYLISGAGPVYEIDKPYTVEDENFSEFDSTLTPACAVKGIEEIESNIDSIKKAIEKCGAVYAQYYIDDDENKGHAVSIIGYDPSKKVWLIRDSGENTDKYYTELPYSTEFNHCITFPDVRKYNKDDTIYQHNKFGEIGCYKFSHEMIVCNTYDFKENEILKEVTLGTQSKGCEYSIYYTESFDDERPSADTRKWKKLTTGIVPYDGYFTASLDNKIKMNGKRGAIIVKINKSTNSNTLPSIRTAENIKKNVSNEYRLKVDRRRKQSYIISQDRFEDIIDRNRRDGHDENSGMGTFSIRAVTEKCVSEES